MEEYVRDPSSNAYFEFNEASCATEDVISSHDMEGSSPESFAEIIVCQEDDMIVFNFQIKAKILLMGYRRSGKKSILQKIAPRWSLSLQTRDNIEKEDGTNTSFLTCHLHDIKGHLDCFGPMPDAASIFGTFQSLIFVIDVQDDYINIFDNLQVLVAGVCRVDPNLKFGVFIHKVDNLSDADRTELERDIHLIACDDRMRPCLQCNGNLSLYLTSIYDQSIHEAVSRVVQKLNPYLPTLENLLNIFTSKSRLQKAFLFNVVSKIYIATDSSPVDMQTFEICCDMIDVVFDVSCIYGERDEYLLDIQSTSVIKLNNHTVLYLRKINRYIALICILEMDIFKKKGFIEYNFYHLQEAVLEVFELWKQIKPMEITPDTITRNLNALCRKYSRVREESRRKTITSPLSRN